jgi:hypothetical protein
MPARMPKPTKGPGPYDHLKPAVRLDYETTDASIRSIAARHGIQSENTVRKWRDTEGWKRDVPAITARLVTRALAHGTDPSVPLESELTIDSDTPALPLFDAPVDGHDTGAPTGTPIAPLEPASPPQPAHTFVDGIPVGADGKQWPWGFGVFVQPTGLFHSIVPKADQDALRPGLDSAIADRRRQKRAEKIVPQVPEVAGAHQPDKAASKKKRGAHSAGGTGAHDDRTGAHAGAHDDAGAVRTTKDASGASHSSVSWLRDEEDRLDVSRGRALAEIHAAALRRHIALSDKLIAMGEVLADNVRIAATPVPDEAPDSVKRAQALAVQRLTSINVDKETMQGMAKAASAVIQMGVSLQRKSLGMDVDAMASRAPQGPIESSDAVKALKQMPAAVLQQLRDLALARARTRPTALIQSAIGARADIDAKIAAGEAAAASAGALAKEIGDTAEALDKALMPETKPEDGESKGA